MRMRIIALALTLVMILSGFAVLVSYAPSGNDNSTLVHSMTNIQTNDTAYEYPIALTFNQKTNSSVFTDVQITVNLAGSHAFVNNLFSNLYFIDSNGVGEPIFITSGSTTGNVTFIAKTLFVNSTDYLTVLPTVYNELGTNVFLATTIDGANYSAVPNTDNLFLEYKSFGNITEGSLQNPSLTSSTNDVGGSGIDFYYSSTSSSGGDLNKYQQQYDGFWFQYALDSSTSEFALYYPLTNEGSNVSYGYVLSGLSYSSDYVATNGFLSNTAPYDPVMAQNTSKNNTDYSFSVNGIYDYLGAYQTGNLINWNVSNNQTTVWNGTYSHIFNTVATGSIVLGNTANNVNGTTYPAITFYYVYAMRYHPFKAQVGSQTLYGVTTS